jgi:hypothetical protein
MPQSANVRFALKAASACLLALAIPVVHAGAQTTTVLNFDDIPLGPVVAMDPTSYLASYGIFLSAVTPGEGAFIFGQGAPGLPVAHSGTNYFQQSTGNNPGTMTLNFSGPLSAISFFRTALTFDSKPEWSAEALDASGNVLSTVGEPLTSSGAVLGAQLFTLTGTDIMGLRFFEDNHDLTNLGGIPIDDLTLVSEAAPVTATPEPGSIVLAMTGFAGIGGIGLRRRSRRA